MGSLNVGRIERGANYVGFGVVDRFLLRPCPTRTMTTTTRREMKWKIERDRKVYDVGDGYMYRHSVVIDPSTGRNIWMTKSITEEVLKTIRREYVPRKSDVFLCTYIKSGTTWVQAILRELIDLKEGTDTRVEGISVGLTEGERIPWIEQMAGIVGVKKWIET